MHRIVRLYSLAAAIALLFTAIVSVQGVHAATLSVTNTLDDSSPRCATRWFSQTMAIRSAMQLIRLKVITFCPFVPRMINNICGVFFDFSSFARVLVSHC